MTTFSRLALLGNGAAHGYVPAVGELTRNIIRAVNAKNNDAARAAERLVATMDKLGIEGVTNNFEIIAHALDILSDLEERQSDPNRWELSAGRSVLSSLVRVRDEIEEIGLVARSWADLRERVCDAVATLMRSYQKNGNEKAHPCVDFIRHLQAQQPTQVFTLNYDHLIEKGTNFQVSATHLHGCIPDSEETRQRHGCESIGESKRFFGR